MCLSKRFKNTGSTGNHGMSEVDMLHRRMIEDKFDTENNKIKVICGTGCEFTLLGDKVSIREALILSDHIHKNNLCPFCRVTKEQIDFEYCVKNQNIMQEFTFTMGDKAYNTMYKPQGYRFLPVEIIEDTE